MLLDPFGKVAPLDELGDDEVQPIVGSTHVVDWDDMGMVEAGEDASFVQVSVDILGPRDSLGRGNFDRDGAVQIVVVSQ